MQVVIPFLLSALGLYLLIGLIFGIALVSVGVKAIDPQAGGTGPLFRLLILPGSVVFWPCLLRRWVGKNAPPEERSAHRPAAR